MSHLKNSLLALSLIMFTQPALASDDSSVTHAKQETQTLELESSDISALRLTEVENEADKNASEIHQESSVGRSGLQGNCYSICPPACPLGNPLDDVQ